MKQTIKECVLGCALGSAIFLSFLFFGMRAKAAEVDLSGLRTIPRYELADMRELEYVPYSQEDLELLAAIVYAEAGDQDFEGQRLTADCICNRVRSNEFPNSIAEVVYQPYQFSPVLDGGLDRAWGNVSESCYEAARLALTGNHIDTQVLYFSMWFCANGEFAYQHGDHYFGY